MLKILNVRPSSLPGTDIEAPFRSSFPDAGGVEARRRRLYSSSSSPLFILCSSSVSYFVVIKLSSLFRTGMCLFSKEIRSPCSSFTSSRLHRNLDDSVTSRSRVVCQEVLKMIFISSNIELQIYGLKLVSLRTYKCTGSTQSVGELTGSVRLSPVATIPRLTIATAPPLTRPSPNADSRSIKFFKFVDSSALSSSSIIFRVTVKVKAIPVSDLSTGLRFSLGFRESYGYRYGNIRVLPLSLTSAPIPPLSISFNYLNRSLFLLWNEDVVLSLMLFLPQFEDVAGSVGFFMKLYLPQYEDITLWCTSFLPKYEVIWTFAFVVLVSIISGLLSWQWWSSSQLSDFIKHGFVVSVFVAVRSPAVHVKILSTDLVNGMWFKAFKFGGFGWSIYGKGEARDSQGSSISLSAGSSLANEAGKMIKALQSAKTCRLSSLQLILESIVLSSAMRSWLDMIKITGLLFRNLVTLFTPLSCTFNQCAATCFAVTFTMSVVSKLCSLITQF
ncbi:hypothetical protein HID58_013561 [Brassica napus]|uniref:Uncharacterized protein n=3 Tax=Brassica TaxID=3705 RepID=A0ABQ8E4A8_BRANA|nr:hypothetical protein HID58_013561 [Brassica napus]